MKVIKTGVDPRTIPLTGTCSTCKTQVEFLQSEGDYHTAYDQRDSEYWSIPCPVCHSSICGYKKSNGGGRYE